MSDSGGIEGASSRVFLQEQVLLAQLTGVKPGETIRELDDIQAQLSCITGSGSHLSAQTAQISHLSSQSPHISNLSSQSPSPSPHVSQLSSQSPHILHLTSQTSHLSSQSPSHSPHISHLSSQSPSQSPHISHLSQSPSHSPHISHLSSQSPSHSPHISHLSSQSPSHLPHISHLSSQSPSHSPHISHLSSQSPSHSPHISHLSSQSPSHSPHISHLSSQSPSHSPHISHLSSQSPSHSPHISHLSSQSPSHSPHISHLSSQSPSHSQHISHLSSQPSQIDLLDQRTQNSDVISGPRVVIDDVVPQNIVEDHNGVIDERHGVIIDGNARTSDLNGEHTGDNLNHKHVLYQTNESRTKDASEHRTVNDYKGPSTIEDHAVGLDQILDNVSQEETRVVTQQPVQLNREEVLSRLNEAEKFISSCYLDVVLVTMDDPTNRPFLNVFSKYPDKFLYDQSSLRMNVKMSDDMKLFCEVLTNNRELVREAAVDNIQVDIKAIMDDLNSARYQSCVGLPSDGHDTILHKIRKSDIQNLLLEKYNGSLIYRARDCRFVVDCKIGETLHCMQCRIMGVELDEKYSKTRALADFVVPDDAVEEELGGTLINKRRRGRPKGSKNKLKSEIVDFKEEPDENGTMFGDILDLPEDDAVEDGSEIVRRVDLEAGMIASGLIGHAIDDEVLMNPIVEVKEDPVTNYHINQTGDNSIRVGPASDSKRGKKKKILSRRQISSKAGRVGRKPKIPLPVQCPEEGCNLSFELIRDYKIHALEHTNTFPCSQATCIKRFKSKSDLEAHERKHRGEKPYSCTECGKSYATKQDLRLHFRKHTGEKPFPCEVCGKCFSRTQQRKIHMVVHTGEKSFLCPECGNSFGSMSTLIDHRKRKHFDMREHKCDQCEKGFFTRQELEAHMRIHTGEKPFLCSYCNKAFARNHHLKRHIDTVHKDGKVRKVPLPVKKTLIEDNFQYQIVNISDTFKKEAEDDTTMLEVTEEEFMLESDTFDVENDGATEVCQDLTGRIVTVTEEEDVENQTSKSLPPSRSFKPHILSQKSAVRYVNVSPGRGVTSGVGGGVSNARARSQGRVGLGGAGSSRVGVAGSLLQLASGRDIAVEEQSGSLVEMVNQNEGFTFRKIGESISEKVPGIITQEGGSTSLRIVESIKEEPDQQQQYFTIIVNQD